MPPSSFLTNYVRQFGDLQTVVLALSMTVPRYIDDPALVRRFEQWREVYRHQINSWGLNYHRVRFDIGLQKFAVDAQGRKLIETAKPQIAVVCGYCSQSLAQFDSHPNGEEDCFHSTHAKTPLDQREGCGNRNGLPKMRSALAEVWCL